MTYFENEDYVKNGDVYIKALKVKKKNMNFICLKDRYIIADIEYRLISIGCKLKEPLINRSSLFIDIDNKYCIAFSKGLKENYYVNLKFCL
ncbi:MAG: hypothetical protein HGB12_02995 [Bacteroidetes bacterium]|nr:hypothetical protein [Bacteroidota bacterium]